MEIEMNNQNDINKERSKRSSLSSIFSNPELKETKISVLRISLLIINIISFFSGFYIYKNKDYYLSYYYNFEYPKLLFIYIVLYTLGMIGTLIFSFLLSVFLKIIDLITNKFNNNISLNENEERHSENSFAFINSHSNEFSIVAYTLTFFIITTATLYLISLPYSIFLLIFLNKNIYYYKPNDFQILYIFVIINMIAGFILFYVLLIIVFVKREGSFRQRNFFIDDNNLNNLRNEIRREMQKAEN